MTKTTVSIAMATYNGAAYLREQLESFLVQTRLPDELVVCDDVSGDATVGILERFARSAPFPVRIRVNERNCGSTRNFDRAIGRCRGDVIFLADQDDIWRLDKVEKVLRALRPGVDMVFSDADVIDASGRRLDYRLWAAAGFTRSLQKRWVSGKALDTLLRRRVVTGATVAFRAELRGAISPIPAVWVHDAWIGLLVAALYRAAFIPEPLVSYRQHGGNQIGVKRSTTFGIVEGSRALMAKNERLSRLKRRVKAYTAIEERLDKVAAPAHVQRQVQRAMRHFKRRTEALEATFYRRCRIVLVEIAKGRYRKYSQGNMKGAVDLIGR